jgi:hypothetical protein
MRLIVLTLALAGCHAATSAPAPGGLTMRVALATAPIGADVAIASASMHLAELVAVSDRSAVDPRAALADVDLALGDTSELALPTAPPGLYSAVDARLGDSTDTGLEVQAVWNSARVHVTLTSAPFDVACANPVRLDPAERAQLVLGVDPSSWFAGIDLGSAASDPDDEGIVISDDDNDVMAAAFLANVTASFTLDCGSE